MTKPPTSTTNNRLRQAREAAGLSREKLSRLVDCSTASIVRWEYGNTPKLSIALALAKQLDIPVQKLFPNKGP